MIFEWRVHSDPAVERRARLDRVQGADFRKPDLAPNVLMVSPHLAYSDQMRMVSRFPRRTAKRYRRPWAVLAFPTYRRCTFLEGAKRSRPRHGAAPPDRRLNVMAVGDVEPRTHVRQAAPAGTRPLVALASTKSKIATLFSDLL